MSERKSLSKKKRLEIFKRDKFTCQYCGRKSPDVVLEIDHVVPVCDGGSNDLLNLVTACFDCNRGKGKNKLDDCSTVERQRKELEIRAIKNEQIEMMLEWKKSLLDINDKEVDAFNNYMKEVSGSSLTDHGKKLIRSYIKKYGLSEVMDAFLLSYNQYAVVKYQNVSVAMDKLPGILRNREIQKTDPLHAEATHLCYCSKKELRDARYKWSEMYNFYHILLEKEISKREIMSVIYSSEYFEEVEEKLSIQ